MARKLETRLAQDTPVLRQLERVEELSGARLLPLICGPETHIGFRGLFHTYTPQRARKPGILLKNTLGYRRAAAAKTD